MSDVMKRIVGLAVAALLVPVGYLFLLRTWKGFKSGHLEIEPS